jgi:dipeptidyl aminopeptidase/acylaminoacyl peptidase
MKKHLTRCAQSGALAALLALLFASAVLAQGPAKSVPLPQGDYKIAQIAVSASGNTILFSSGAADAQHDVYLFDLKSGQVKKVVTANGGRLWSTPGAHAFAVSATDALYLVEENGTVASTTAMHNPTGELGWSRDGSQFVFPTDKPKTDQGSDKYDPSAFTAIGILEVSSGKIRMITFKDSAFHLHLVQPDGKIYVSDNSLDTSKPLVVKVYDLKGHALDQRNDLFGIFFSPTGRYYLPLIGEQGMPFRIRNGEGDRSILYFANESEDEISDPVWNPQNDDWLLTRHATTEDEGRRVKSQELEVWSVSQRTPLENFPFGVAAWTPDGKSVVIFRDGKFVFEQVAP